MEDNLLANMKAQWTLIRPDTAAEMMKRNKRKRPLNSKRINHLARDMREGRWKPTGETIQFFEDQSLADGQHRLQACIRSGVSFWSWVITGVPLPSRSAVDIGTSRTGADILAIDKEKYVAALSAGLSLLYAFVSGE